MSGEQGFFINNNPIGPLAMSQCSSTGGRRPDTLFCSGCLQYVVIEARELGPSKLVITSRSDPAKTLQLEGFGGLLPMNKITKQLININIKMNILLSFSHYHHYCDV